MEENQVEFEEEMSRVANETDHSMRIEWWENEAGEFNWHAMSGTSDNPGNNEVLFGSVQGYTDRGAMLRVISTWFPQAEIAPRDGEPESSHTKARAAMIEEGRAADEEDRDL